MAPIRAAALLALLTLLPLGSPPEADAQELVPGLLGGAAGLAAGGYVSVGIWAWKARQGEYLYAARDALGWEATPILVGSATGFALGLSDPDRLRRTVIGGTIGGFVGTGIGLTLGNEFWQPPEGGWAGGVIGGGIGLMLGGAVGMLWSGGGDEAEDGSEPSGGIFPVIISIPLGGGG